MSTDATAGPRQAPSGEGRDGGAIHRPLLAVRDLRVHFPIRSGPFQRIVGFVRAVDGVTFEIAPGESFGLVGESGSGKSTTGRAILGLIPATAGAIEFDGRDVRHARGAAMARFRRDAQIVFQDPGSSLNPRMRVAEILAEPLLVHGIERGREALRRRATALLDRCGMPASAMDRYPHEFSGGQRQRIAIARALALSPRLIVCDEPTSALDVSIQAQIINLLSDLQRDEGLAYLFISHDLNLVRHLCGRLAVMQHGRLIETLTRGSLAHPAHEYTRRLLEAVPVPDPGRVSA